MPNALERVEIVVATLRAFLAGVQAERAIVLVDRGARLPALLLDCTPGRRIEAAEGDRGFELPEQTGRGAAPLPLPPLTALAPPEVDPAEGRIVAPLGALERAAGAVRALAEALGGDSVASVQFRTADPSLPMLIAAREGEPVVVTLGDEQFELGEPSQP